MASQTDEPVQETFEKEVNLIAYAGDDSPRQLRRWVEAVTGVDVTSFERESKTKWTLEADFGGTFPMSRKLGDSYFDEERIKKEKKKLEKADANVTLSSETKTFRSYENTLAGAGKNLLKAISEEFPDVLNDEFMREFHGNKLRWKNDVGQVAVSISTPDWEERRVLAKETNRSGDDLYESLTEKNSAQFNIDMEAETEEQLDEFTETFVEMLHKVMSRQEGVGKVRYMECEIVTRREGECYDI